MKKENYYIISFLHSVILLCICLFLATPFSSCKKDKINTSSTLSISTDTLTFDTLFTTLGSTTRFFTIRNTQKQAIKISNIKLGGGATSSYRINIDGDAGINFSDIEIPAKDSIYVFVEVTVNPNAANLPFVLLDSIQFSTNGVPQKVILQAYGQNAHFFNADSIQTNTIWTNDKPYVILNYLQINPSACLTIQQGCTIYFGGGAAMLIEGCLNINGIDTSNMVTFRGVRTDKDIAGRSYDDFPGQYAGVFFLRGSTGNINYLKMRNSAYGLNVGNIKTTDNAAQNLAELQSMSITNAPNVIIKNSKIYNNEFYGIFGFLGKLKAENSLIYNCGKNVVGIYDGGEYAFTNCTFYSRGSSYISHSKTPVFYFNNYFVYSSTQQPLLADSSKAIFENCIVYGTLDDEIVQDDEATNPHKIKLQFFNSIVKTQTALQIPLFNTCKIDDPQFEDIYKNNYKLKNTSPCSNFGIPILINDIDGFIRNNPPDVGAYEIQ